MSKPFNPETVDLELLYTGIGSRKVTLAVRAQQTRLATELELLGYWQFSGGAPGSDQAFEFGCRNHTSIVPWNGFEGRPMFHSIPDLAYTLAKQYHPAYHVLGQGGRKMMARNSQQVLSPMMIYPVKFVLCWTPDGCTHHRDRTRETGGTGQAISVASMRGIPVINMFNPGWSQVLSELLDHDFTFIERGEFTNEIR